MRRLRDEEAIRVDDGCGYLMDDRRGAGGTEAETGQSDVHELMTTCNHFATGYHRRQHARTVLKSHSYCCLADLGWCSGRQACSNCSPVLQRPCSFCELLGCPCTTRRAAS